jgi:hypothetical protein
MLYSVESGNGLKSYPVGWLSIVALPERGSLRKREVPWKVRGVTQQILNGPLSI